MFQFVYISTMSRSVSPVSIAEIFVTSQRNNNACGISGVLLHRGRRFLQVLEGAQQDVLATVGRIRVDPRHCAMVTLSEGMAASPASGGWAMASDRDLSADQVLDRINFLTRNAHPNLRAQFISYAAMEIAA